MRDQTPFWELSCVSSMTKSEVLSFCNYAAKSSPNPNISPLLLHPLFFAFRTIVGQNLTGTLPTELAKFPLLQSISLPYNELEGEIPVEYSQVKRLLNLELHGNMLSGTIPEDFFNGEGNNGLQNFNVGENLLSGTISTGLGFMTNLKGLHIFENLFTGSFPSQIERLGFLSYMRINNNLFTGSIPTGVGRLRQLNEMWMHASGFTGNIPSEIGNLDRRLGNLRLSENKLTGTIPEELYELTRLSFLDLQKNYHEEDKPDYGLSGTISTNVGKLTDLISLQYSFNRLTGTIPTEVTNLSRMRLFWTHINLLSGSMPQQICQRVGPGNLEFLQTDCGPEISPVVDCLCCSACCDRDTGICLLYGFDE